MNILGYSSPLKFTYFIQNVTKIFHISGDDYHESNDKLNNAYEEPSSLTGGYLLRGTNINRPYPQSRDNNDIDAAIANNLAAFRHRLHGHLNRNFDTFGESNFVRNLDHIGGGHLIRNLDGDGNSYTESEPMKRNLDSIGGANLIKRTLDSIGGANLIKRTLDSIGGAHLLKRSVDPLGGGYLIKK